MKNMHSIRALGAQPRRRKPAFVTHDNEASLCAQYVIGSICRICQKKCRIICTICKIICRICNSMSPNPICRICQIICQIICSICQTICLICSLEQIDCLICPICKICKIICTICTICNHDFNMSNMHSPLC